MSWLMGIVTWVKSHVLVSIIVGIVVVGSALAVPIIISNTGTETKTEYKTNIELSDNLSFEINSELYLMSLIKKISNGELITENYKIDTSKLGSQEVIIKYFNEKQEEAEHKFNIDIVDTTKPVIEFNKELSTTSGNKIDLLKDVKVTDNSNEEIKATVEGEYDFNKVGSYNLKYVAVDSSNNKTEEEFTLIIKNVALKTNGYYVATNGKKDFDYRYGSIKFYSGNQFDWVTCLGATDYGTGAFYRGTYRIDGNKLILNVNKMLDMQGWVSYSETFNYTIINENAIKLDNGYTYKWQSKQLDSTSHPKNL